MNDPTPQENGPVGGNDRATQNSKGEDLHMDYTSEPSGTDHFFGTVRNATDTRVVLRGNNFRDLVALIATQPTIKPGSDPRETKRSCPMLSAAKFAKPVRANDSIAGFTALVGDYDQGIVSIEDAADIFRGYGFQAVLYETPTCEPDSPRWRVIAELSATVNEAEYLVLLGKLNSLFKSHGSFGRESWSVRFYFFGAVEGKPSRVIPLNGIPFDQLPGVDGFEDYRPPKIGPLNTVDRESRNTASLADIIREAESRIESGLGKYTEGLRTEALLQFLVACRRDDPAADTEEELTRRAEWFGGKFIEPRDPTQEQRLPGWVHKKWDYWKPRPTLQEVQEAFRDGEGGDVKKPKATHPWLRFRESGKPQPPRMLVPGFIQYGIVLFAGPPGGGKTTAIVPLSMTVAGLLGHESITPKHWRYVLFITEDPEQVERIIWGLVKHHNLEEEVVRDRVKVVEAARLPITEVLKSSNQIQERLRREVTVAEGRVVPLDPLVILDTKSATLQMEDENSNSETSAVIAALKTGFRFPTWVSTHLAKANTTRSDVRGLSTRGAGANDADVHQTIFVLEDENFPGERFLCLGKRRFEASVQELRVRTEVRDLLGNDEFGDLVSIPVRYGLIEPMEEDRRVAAREAAATSRREEKEERVLKKIREAMAAGDLDLLFITSLVTEIGGGSATRALIREMEAEGKLVSLPVPEDLRAPRAPKDLAALATSGTEAGLFFARVRHLRDAG